MKKLKREERATLLKVIWIKLMIIFPLFVLSAEVNGDFEVGKSDKVWILTGVCMLLLSGFIYMFKKWMDSQEEKTKMISEIVYMMRKNSQAIASLEMNHNKEKRRINIYNDWRIQHEKNHLKCKNCKIL